MGTIAKKQIHRFHKNADALCPEVRGAKRIGYPAFEVAHLAAGGIAFYMFYYPLAMAATTVGKSSGSVWGINLAPLKRIMKSWSTLSST